MSYAEAIQPVSGLVVTDTYLVRAIVDSTGFARVYDPTLGGSVAANSANLPTLTVVSQVTQETQNVLTADANTSTVDGAFKCTIVPAAADLVNASSVTAPVWLMPGTAISGAGDAGGTQLITATGTN